MYKLSTPVFFLFIFLLTPITYAAPQANPERAIQYNDQGEILRVTQRTEKLEVQLPKNDCQKLHYDSRRRKDRTDLGDMITQMIIDGATNSNRPTERYRPRQCMGSINRVVYDVTVRFHRKRFQLSTYRYPGKPGDLVQLQFVGGISIK